MFEQVCAAVFFLTLEHDGVIEEEGVLYGNLEDRETRELLSFVKRAQKEIERRSASRALKVRITRGYRIFVGDREIKVRPMAKSVLLLFLSHPEGIILKDIYDYRGELLKYYGAVSRSSEPGQIRERVKRLLDLCSNELNVNISRVNSAMSAMLDGEQAPMYTINGTAGQKKAIPLERCMVEWD